MDTFKPPRGIVVFGGGTATNSLVDVFENLRRSRNCSLQYIIPISDNGGSSSELIRVFGGPGRIAFYLLSSEPTYLGSHGRSLMPNL